MVLATAQEADARLLTFDNRLRRFAADEVGEAACDS